MFVLKMKNISLEFASIHKLCLEVSIDIQTS